MIFPFLGMVIGCTSSTKDSLCQSTKDSLCQSTKDSLCQKLLESPPDSMEMTCTERDGLFRVQLDENFTKELLGELQEILKKGHRNAWPPKFANFVDVEIYTKNAEEIHLEFSRNIVNHNDICIEVDIDEVFSWLQAAMCPSEECTRAKNRQIKKVKLYDRGPMSILFKGITSCKYCPRPHGGVVVHDYPWPTISHPVVVREP